MVLFTRVFCLTAASNVRAGPVRLRPSGGRRARLQTRRLHSGPGQLWPQLVEGRLSQPDGHVPTQLRHACQSEHVKERKQVISESIIINGPLTFTYNQTTLHVPVNTLKVRWKLKRRRGMETVTQNKEKTRKDVAGEAGGFLLFRGARAKLLFLRIVMSSWTLTVQTELVES